MPKAEGLHTYLVTCCHRNASLMLMPFMALNPQGDLKNKQMNKKNFNKNGTSKEISAGAVLLSICAQGFPTQQSVVAAASFLYHASYRNIAIQANHLNISISSI